ncbi:MAG: hypothetical protein LBJ84_00260 [Oscillospiraceae bacterium]|jgi:hypothetical protein|nr:hypothetical protein [Oscillospiraceae bacterium]
MRQPEPSLEPPEPYSVLAGCGCEVYEGEYLYDDPNDRQNSLCESCFREALGGIPAKDLAFNLGIPYTEVKPITAKIYEMIGDYQK